jgi:predicted transcriptional regulator
MAKPTKFEIENDTPGVHDEDNETLAAIDEGVRDARAGRTLSAEEVRTRLPKWITTSFTRKER